MNKYVKAVVTLVSVVTLSTVSVWGVHEITSPIVTERNEKAANDAWTSIAGAFEAVDVTSSYKGAKDAGITLIKELTLANSSKVYGLQVETNGYNGTITYAMVLDLDNEKIVGVKNISNTETSTKGAIILDSDSYMEYFKDKSFSDAINSKQAGADIVSGASTTTSSLDGSVSKVISFLTGGEIGRFKKLVGEPVSVKDITKSISYTKRMSTNKTLFGDITGVYEMTKDNGDKVYGIKGIAVGYDGDIVFGTVIDVKAKKMLGITIFEENEALGHLFLTGDNKDAYAREFKNIDISGRDPILSKTIPDSIIGSGVNTATKMNYGLNNAVKFALNNLGGAN